MKKFLLASYWSIFFILLPLTACTLSKTAKPPDADQIKAVIEQAYGLLGYASQTYDVSGFPEVFIDTPDYQITEQQRTEFADQTGVTLAGDAGYLTAMMAKYAAYGRGNQLLQAALDKAQSENRDITAEELQAVAQANYGQMPPSASITEETTEFMYDSITIDGNRAVVRYDDGAALQEAILVKVNGQWFIAGITPVWIHF